MMFALQILYIILGVGLNTMSLLHRWRSGMTLTPVNPYAGLVAMAAYTASAAAKFFAVPFADAALLAMLVVIGYGGIWRHLVADEYAYESTSFRWYAITINSFGVLTGAATLTT